MNKPKKVAILTAGGLAPCLNSAIGSLIERYTEIDPTIEIICYRSGYKGLLLGDYYEVTPEIRKKAGKIIADTPDTTFVVIEGEKATLTPKPSKPTASSCCW